MPYVLVLQGLAVALPRGNHMLLRLATADAAEKPCIMTMQLCYLS